MKCNNYAIIIFVLNKTTAIVTLTRCCQMVMTILQIMLLFLAGMWEQWDTIVFPKRTQRSTSINPEDLEQVVAKCLPLHLSSYQKKLQSCNTDFGTSQTVNDVKLIFNQLSCRLIGYESKTGDGMYSHREWFSQKLNSVCSFTIIACSTFYFSGFGPMGNEYRSYFINRAR